MLFVHRKLYSLRGVVWLVWVLTNTVVTQTSSWYDLLWYDNISKYIKNRKDSLHCSHYHIFLATLYFHGFSLIFFQVASAVFVGNVLRKSSLCISTMTTTSRWNGVSTIYSQNNWQKRNCQPWKDSLLSIDQTSLFFNDEIFYAKCISLFWRFRLQPLTCSTIT